MIELDESLNKSALVRLAARYTALSYRTFFLSHEKLRPINEFDPARHQSDVNLKPRHKLPRGAEYINNFRVRARGEERGIVGALVVRSSPRKRGPRAMKKKELDARFRGHERRSYPSPRSSTSSSVRQPWRRALTSTAMFPGGCWFFIINVCASGMFSHGKTLLMHGSMRRSSTN